MSKKAKTLAVLIGAAVIILIVWTVSTIPEPPPATPPEPPGSTMSYDGNTLSEEKNGRKIWDLTADHIDVDVNTQNVKMENLKGHFYQEDGRVVEVTAKEGTYTAESHDVEIKGEVQISLSDGGKLTSDSLMWSNKEGKLSAIGNVTAEKENMKATGDRVESTDGFSELKIIGNATAQKDDMQAKGDCIESTDGFSKLKITGHAHIDKGVAKAEGEQQ
jgi:hypothetical protein